MKMGIDPNGKEFDAGQAWIDSLISEKEMNEAVNKHHNKENKEQLELALEDVKRVIKFLDPDDEKEMDVLYESRCEIEAELNDLHPDHSFKKLIRQSYAADKYFDKALTAFTHLKQQIELAITNL